MIYTYIIDEVHVYPGVLCYVTECHNGKILYANNQRIIYNR